MTLRIPKVVIVSSALICLAGCGKPQERIKGIWLVDGKETEAHNEKLLAGNPFAKMRIGATLATAPALLFADNEFTAFVGDEQFTSPYTFVSLDDGIMTLKFRGKEAAFKFISADLIFALDEQEPKTVYRRQSGDLDDLQSRRSELSAPFRDGLKKLEQLKTGLDDLGQKLKSDMESLKQRINQDAPATR